MFPSALHPTRRELAHRSTETVEVSLVWDEADGTVALLVLDRVLDEHVEVEVPRERALDAFQRPDAYVVASKARVPRRRLGLMRRRPARAG